MRWKSQYEWHTWFAWKPVTITDYSTTAGGVQYPLQIRVWLEWVERKLVNSSRWDYRFPQKRRSRANLEPR